MGKSRTEQTITIERRFRGPPASGNGGYVCGRLAMFIDGCARVRLMIPPPLEVPMTVVMTADGADLCHDDQVVAQARPYSFTPDLPACPALADARAMSSRYGGFKHHPFPGCFVCGPRRDEGDGLRIFPGPSDDRTLVGCPWTVHESLCDRNGLLRPWFVWCALDCPSGWSIMHESGRPAVLGELAVQISSPVICGSQMIVTGWEIGHSGRKHQTGSALYDSAGGLVACGQATWFEIERDAL